MLYHEQEEHVEKIKQDNIWLKYYRYWYYVESDPRVPDSYYDKREKEAEAYAEEHGFGDHPCLEINRVGSDSLISYSRIEIAAFRNHDVELIRNIAKMKMLV